MFASSSGFACASDEEVAMEEDEDECLHHLQALPDLRLQLACTSEDAAMSTEEQSRAGDQQLRRWASDGDLGRAAGQSHAYADQRTQGRNNEPNAGKEGCSNNEYQQLQAHGCWRPVQDNACLTSHTDLSFSPSGCNTESTLAFSMPQGRASASQLGAHRGPASRCDLEQGFTTPSRHSPLSGLMNTSGAGDAQCPSSMTMSYTSPHADTPGTSRAMEGDICSMNISNRSSADSYHHRGNSSGPSPATPAQGPADSQQVLAQSTMESPPQQQQQPPMTEQTCLPPERRQATQRTGSNRPPSATPTASSTTRTSTTHQHPQQQQQQQHGGALDQPYVYPIPRYVPQHTQQPAQAQQWQQQQPESVYPIPRYVAQPQSPPQYQRMVQATALPRARNLLHDFESAAAPTTAAGHHQSGHGNHAYTASTNSAAPAAASGGGINIFGVRTNTSSMDHGVSAGRISRLGPPATPLSYSSADWHAQSTAQSSATPNSAPTAANRQPHCQVSMPGSPAPGVDHNQMMVNYTIGSGSDIACMARQQGAGLLDMADRLVQTWRGRFLQADAALQDLQLQTWVVERRATAAAEQLSTARVARLAAEEAAMAAKMAQAEADGKLASLVARAEAAEGALQAAQQQAEAAEALSAGHQTLLDQKDAECAVKVAEAVAAQEAAKREVEMALAKQEELAAKAAAAANDLSLLQKRLEETQQAAATAAAQHSQQLQSSQEAVAAAELLMAAAVSEGQRQAGEAERTAGVLAAARREVSALQAQCGMHQAACHEARSQQAELSSQLHAALQEGRALSTALAEASADIADKRAALHDLSKDVSRLGLLATNAHNQVGELTAAVKAREDEVGSLRAALEEARRHLADLQEQCRMQQASLEQAQHREHQLKETVEGQAHAAEEGELEMATCRGQLEAARQAQQQLSRRVQCMAGQEEALAAQSLETLESLAGVLEAALPSLRNAIVAKRVQAARSEVHEHAACAVCLAAPRDTFLQCGHLICRGCSERVERCPICRTAIVNRSRAFV